MKLGLVADIHEEWKILTEALAHFRRAKVEEIIFLGDIVCMARALEETTALMREAKIVGVWGNHDFGFCRHVDDELKAKYSKPMLDFMAALQPRLIRDDVHFSHVEAWLDPLDLCQLWFFEGLPTTTERLAQSFAAVPQRVLLSGHVHRWYLATPDGPLAWNGEEPIRLAPPTRYYLTLHALCEGHCAVYETTTGELTPIRLSTMREPV